MNLKFWIIVPLLASYVIEASQKYITSQVICDLTPKAKSNINNVQLISIDTYPDSFKYNKYIKRNIIIPEGSGIEKKYCNSHCDNTMGGALGIRTRNGVPSLRNINVTFIPGLLCTGSGYEPYLVASINTAIKIASNNALEGKKTVTVYSIGGTYNTLEKIEAMKKLTEIPGSYVVTVIGNHEGQYDNCPLKFFQMIPKLIIVGGTQNGSQLLNISMVGPCVNFYAPGRYKSPVTKKVISGVSFSGPIVANLITNYILNNLNATREQILTHLTSLTDVIPAKTAQGTTIYMNVFRKNGICSV